MQRGNFAEAEAAFRRLVAQASMAAEAYCYLGIVLAEQGRLKEAIAALREAVRRDPNFAHAHNNLGLVLMRAGETAEAADCYHRAIALKSDFAQAHYNLGLAFKALGEHEAAIHQYQQALRFQPDYPKALCDLGTALAERGKGAEAVVCFKQELELRPEYVPAHFNLAVVYESQGRRDDALRHYRLAVKFNPDHLQARLRLGAVLVGQNDFEGAADCLMAAARLEPKSGEARRHLGLVRLEQGLVEEAIDHFRWAAELETDSGPARVALGNALADIDRWEEAESVFRQLLQERPEMLAASNGLGVALHRQGRFGEALTLFDEALKHCEGDPDTRLNRALVLLLQGNWAAGWAEHEFRLKTARHRHLSTSLPRWDGSPLEGKTLLVQTEQGLGDTLQFIRYVPLIEKSGGTVIVQCQPALVNLLACVKEVDRLVPAGAPLKAIDVHAHLLSLPWIMNTSLANVPAKVPYLNADAGLAKQWRRELEAMKGFKVGIAWQGKPTFVQDRLRSIPLAQWKPLAAIEGVQLVSLQKGPGCEQLRELAGEFRVADLGTRLDQTTGGFMDTAAVMQSLDLVITSDTAVAHLAGALGAPVWVALPFVPDWRWMLDRTDSPWYPTMKLFRQKQAGNWEDVFARMARDLDTAVRAAAVDANWRQFARGVWGV